MLTFSESEQRFREVADEIPLMVWAFSPDARGTFFNKAWLEFTGRSLEQEIGIGWTDSVHPEDMLKCADALVLKFGAQQNFTIEHRLRRFDGQYRLIFTTCTPRAEAGIFLGYVAWSVDITDSKASEKQATSRCEQRFELLASATNDASWEWDLESSSIWCNEQFFATFGYSPADEITFDFWVNAIHPDERGNVTKSLDSAFADKAALWVEEYRFRRADGSYATVVDRAVIVYGNDGAPIHMTGSMRDISAEREAVAGLKASELRNRMLIEHASDAIFMLDEHCNVIEANSRTCSMLGYNAEELLKLNIRDVMLPEDLEDVSLAILALPDADGVVLERNYRRKDGMVLVVENSVKRIVPGTIQVIARDVSARMKAEQALRDSEVRYRTLVETATEGIWMGDANDHTVFVNTKMAEMVGCSVEECLAISWVEFIHPDDLPIIQARIAQRTNAVGDPFDLRLIRRNGLPLWVQISTCALSDHSGERVGQLSTVTNINERKYAEEQLRLTAARLETIVGNAPLGIATTDAQGQLIETNAAFQSMLGYSADDLKSLTVLDLTHPDDRKLSAHQLDEMCAGRCDRYELEKRYIRKDGSVIWAHIVVASLRSSPLGNVKTIGLAEDITDRKEIFDELQRSEARFRALLDSNVIGIAFMNANGDIGDANDAFLQIVGYNRTELEAGLGWRKLTPPGFEAADDKAIRELSLTGVFRPFEKQYIRKDRSRVSVVIGGARYRDDKATVFVLDLTQLKIAQREVDRLAHIVESTDDAVISVALDGTVLSWNKGAERLYGYAASEIIGRSEVSLLPNGRDEDLEKAKARAADGGTLDHFEAIRLTKSNEPKPVSLTVSPMRDDDGQIVGWSKIARDLTHVKRAEQLEEQFRQAQKLEAVGRLAGGVAHDFNNLLMIISSHTEMIQNKLAPDDRLRNKTREVLKASEKAADLTQQLLAFSRKQVLLPQIVNVNAIVREIVTMAKRLIGAGIHVSFLPSWELWTIQADPGQISQVLLNLLINARDAMPNGGNLTIETRNMVVDDPMSLRHIPSFIPGSYVVITVTDKGLGMSEETKARIFEPFFTTKESKGTGLGLSTVYGIVKQSGGYIWVQSAPGMGTSFELYFPKADKAADPVIFPGPAQLQHRGETILVVEDEAALRSSVSEYLNELGYVVLEAETGKRAIEIGNSYQGRIHLLLTDVVMPEMSGVEVAKHLNKRPEMKTLYMSGYTDEAIAGQTALGSSTAFIHKPFPLNALATKLAEMLLSRQTEQRIM
jgi:two-component system, cell cycle sensor histidine kinase and response regulator CckA